MIRVGIVGATGMVGQQFISLLQQHPWFQITLLAASSRSAGLPYGEAVKGRWKVSQALPPANAAMKVVAADDLSAITQTCDFVFCAVDLSKTETKALEDSYAAAGLPVFSNNSAQRFEDDVPMIIPEVNPGHLDLIVAQKKQRGYDKGFVVVKPNCSLQSYVPVLAALRKFNPNKVFVTTFQAISGAGKLLEEVPELQDNCIPLPGEEGKSEQEPLKILGELAANKIVSSTIKISAHCHRIPTNDGHLAAVSVGFGTPCSIDDGVQSVRSFVGEPQRLELPSAPVPCLTYFEEETRPQVKLDRLVGKGMGIAVGRIRPCPLLDIKFLALSHNTIRGAAGGALLTAELAHKKGLF